uniref:Uncharacterized protein n=1 Tax=Timema cristinae TaxID=61476 RepID=A0A7R9CBD7_TIMCR|nr:unnamed protein product [Timema cristinae]
MAKVSVSSWLMGRNAVPTLQVISSTRVRETPVSVGVAMQGRLPSPHPSLDDPPSSQNLCPTSDNLPTQNKKKIAITSKPFEIRPYDTTFKKKQTWVCPFDKAEGCGVMGISTPFNQGRYKSSCPSRVGRDPYRGGDLLNPAPPARQDGGTFQPFTLPGNAVMARESYDGQTPRLLGDYQANSTSTRLEQEYLRFTTVFPINAGTGYEVFFKSVVPLVRSGAKAFGKHALHAGIDVLSNVANQRRPFKEALRQRVNEVGTNLKPRRMSFTRALTETINCIVYGEFANVKGAEKKKFKVKYTTTPVVDLYDREGGGGAVTPEKPVAEGRVAKVNDLADGFKVTIYSCIVEPPNWCQSSGKTHFDIIQGHNLFLSRLVLSTRQTCTCHHDDSLTGLLKKLRYAQVDGIAETVITKALSRDDYDPPKIVEEIPLTTEYHPGLQRINTILKSGYKFLTSFTETQNLLSSPPRVTFKRPPNLHNILVHPKLLDPKRIREEKPTTKVKKTVVHDPIVVGKEKMGWSKSSPPQPYRMTWPLPKKRLARSIHGDLENRVIDLRHRTRWGVFGKNIEVGGWGEGRAGRLTWQRWRGRSPPFAPFSPTRLVTPPPPLNVERS